MNIAYFSCSICGAVYSSGEVQYVCPRDGGNLTVHLEYETAARKPNPADILESKDQEIKNRNP